MNFAFVFISGSLFVLELKGAHVLGPLIKVLLGAFVDFKRIEGRLLLSLRVLVNAHGFYLNWVFSSCLVGIGVTGVIIGRVRPLRVAHALASTLDFFFIYLLLVPVFSQHFSLFARVENRLQLAGSVSRRRL